MNTIFIFPLALLLPVISISSKARPLAILSLLRLPRPGIWAHSRFGSFSALSNLGNHGGFGSLGTRKAVDPSSQVPPTDASIVSATIVTTLAYIAIYVAAERPIPTVVGLASRDTYLEDIVYDYNAMRFIVTSLSPDDRVLQLWDGQSYYCDARCIPDTGQVMAPYMHALANSPDEMMQQLQAGEVSRISWSTLRGSTSCCSTTRRKPSCCRQVLSH